MPMLPPAGFRHFIRFAGFPFALTGTAALTWGLLALGVPMAVVPVPVSLTLLVYAMALETLVPLDGAGPEAGERRCDFQWFLSVLFFSHPLASAIVAGIAAALAPLLPGGPLSTWPTWLGALVCLVIRDLIAYGVHRAQHRYAWLWRTHIAHHLPHRVTATNALRSHPLSVLFASLSVIIPMLLGATPMMLVIVGLARGVNAIFTHIDADLRYGPFNYVFVTQFHHRWHHADRPEEGGLVNYGSVFIIFDRLFGTYKPPARDKGPTSVGIFGDHPERHNFWPQLLAPFRPRGHEMRPLSGLPALGRGVSHLLDSIVARTHRLTWFRGDYHPYFFTFDVAMVGGLAAGFLFRYLDPSFRVGVYFAAFALCYAAYTFVYLPLKRRLTGTAARSYLQDLVLFLLPLYGLSSWLMGQNLSAAYDVVGLMLPWVLACMRSGCFLGGCCHGHRASVGVHYRPEHLRTIEGWRKFSPGKHLGERVLPTQLMEAAANLCILLGLGLRQAQLAAPDGRTLPLYLIACGLVRLVLEPLRGHRHRPKRAGLSEAQWLAAASVVLCTVYLSST